MLIQISLKVILFLLYFACIYYMILSLKIVKKEFRRLYFYLLTGVFLFLLQEITPICVENVGLIIIIFGTLICVRTLIKEYAFMITPLHEKIISKFFS